ncbi:uncharacterized protein BDW43DRAFT_321601 [Aspergillus alliaceus]|uniref:uncharacterized protein n=1 Tax=Petromyces alliaceus TaxID=209559 RepID=UPI0012A55BB8|nr:uncharacterized protein BDW43DRAFT_321601 [Aspergillus alliaceus]KAB8230313.1 hypothetical protein BDW43DRAFT_321601 [Aspergillus alliaceus]
MQSGIVEFVIGINQQQFSIHAALAGYFPKEIFQPSINGQVDEIVFGHCCEFIYSGDYSIPLPTADLCRDDNDKPSDSQTLSREKLDKASLDEGVPDNNLADNYAAVFLSYAEVYHFAYTADWDPLYTLLLYLYLRKIKDMDNMRDMLVHYAVWNIEIIMRDTNFQ